MTFPAEDVRTARHARRPCWRSTGGFGTHAAFSPIPVYPGFLTYYLPGPVSTCLTDHSTCLTDHIASRCDPDSYHAPRYNQKNHTLTCSCSCSTTHLLASRICLIVRPCPKEESAYCIIFQKGPFRGVNLRLLLNLALLLSPVTRATYRAKRCTGSPEGK